jgi:DNA gyrase subunit A
VEQFTPHKRGGVGIRSAVVNKKTGPLIGVKSLEGLDQEVIIISAEGQTIRLGLRNIPSLGRATQGVRIMRLNGGDQVVSLALVEKVEEVEEETAEAPAANKPAKRAEKPAPTKK